jgi:hypothetical protein
MILGAVSSGHAPSIRALLRGGVLEVAMAALQQSSPLEWVGMTAVEGGVRLASMQACGHGR